MTFIPGIGETGPLTGPLVLGYMLGCILVGILTMQVNSYYNNFPNDRAWIKWLVGILFGFEMIFTLFTLINAWAAFGTGWGDVTSLQFQHWSLVPIPLLSGIIASIVQYFFAYRIYKLTNRIWLPILIAAISALQCVMVFYVGITNAVRGRSFVAFYQLSTFISIWLAGDAVCDILIAISTVTILVRASRKSHFRNTDTTLQRLIRLTVETGLITASGATIELILWQVEKFLNYHYIFFLVLGKLYSNALMAALNSRTHINAGTSQANMSVNSSINTRNHLTLFEDEYSNTDSTGKSTRVAVGRSVNVRHDPSHEMVVVSTKQSFNTDMTKVSDSKIHVGDYA
ncbi:hypothetical protein D9619_007767 [Psilocybe cf. subviscida]|uniref:DUF6534 domain-containing protein n=1 Tax=Psilocybe cf. subviscida TaxID=2480587 RepID=A0A8H5ATH2_9AGAR|nr:hypothetical protein D9619_007767 [Psilocybe cf. subviscida]